MQDIFKRLINEIFLLKFKPYGWKKQGSNFRYIDASGLGRVINFQKSKWNTADELEFFINYGLYIEIDNQLVNKSFKEYECQFRARTGLDKGSFHLNSDTDFETLQRRVEQALDKAINQCLLIKQIFATSNSYICPSYTKTGTDAKEHKVFASES